MDVKIAFLVNPLAGMGGSVGLKGTDGAEILHEALKRGATPVAPSRAVQALLSLRGRGVKPSFITCSGAMGHDELREAGIEAVIVYAPKGSETTAEDTRLAAREFLAQGPDLIVFAGGDGTARDIFDAVGSQIPLVGIPAGVKMHSAVFVTTPDALGGLIESFDATGQTKDGEVMDVDEESFRRGTLEARLYGYARVPDDSVSVQGSKATYHYGSADEEADEIGQYMAETMAPDTAFILGPGTTTAAIARRMGVRKTLLGVDVLLGGRLILEDATEKQLLELLDRVSGAVVVVTPIGSQGFIFGRGNQQISARVLRRVGPGGICVVATPTKLRHTPALRVDTGDRDLDSSLRGSIRVVTGYKRRRLVQVT